jgi:aspartyl protease family protein
MPSDGGPWGSRTPDPPPRGGRRGLWLLLLLVGAVGLLIFLFRTFPESLRDRQDGFQLVYLLGFLVLLSTGVFRASRSNLKDHLKHAAIWVAVISVAAVAFAYRDVFEGAAQRLRIAFSDGTPVPAGPHELVIPQDADGAFVVIALVNGQRVRFMVDTGATATVLSPEDARRAGIDPSGLHYDSLSETANGTGSGARTTVRTLAVGPIMFDNFEVTVNQAPMSGSLLGVSFLDRLQSFHVEGHKLILKW